MSNVYKFGEYQFCMALLTLYTSFYYITITPWSIYAIISSSMLLAGVKINGNWRYSPHLRLAGSLASALTIGILSVRYPVLYGATIFYLWFVFLNVSDVKKCLRTLRIWRIR